MYARRRDGTSRNVDVGPPAVATKTDRGKRVMTWWIAGYVAVGALFGLATFAHRHRFSEGTARPTGAGERDAFDGRAMWVVLCAGLWPIFALTGLYSLLRGPRRP
jgi:hypothetical protein